MNKYQQQAEMWEIQMILYFILGVLVDKMENIHWLAILIWIYSIITFIGVLAKAYKGKKLEESQTQSKEK